jgi:hypothetical protein
VSEGEKVEERVVEAIVTAWELRSRRDSGVR